VIKVGAEDIVATRAALDRVAAARARIAAADARSTASGGRERDERERRVCGSAFCARIHQAKSSEDATGGSEAGSGAAAGEVKV
jgi:predicted phage gp36 major capsid-like protein